MSAKPSINPLPVMKTVSSIGINSGALASVSSQDMSFCERNSICIGFLPAAFLTGSKSQKLPPAATGFNLASIW